MRELVDLEPFSFDSACIDRYLKAQSTFAMRDRRNERIRNLKRSSSVWSMTRVKLDLGSMVPVMSSMVSIYFCHPVSTAAPLPWPLKAAVLAYLLLQPRHHPIHQICRVGEQLRRSAFVDPCSGQGLEIERARRNRRSRDRRENVANVGVHVRRCLDMSLKRRAEK